MVGVTVAAKKPPPSLKSEDGINLLNQLDASLKKEYYDPTFGGIDLKSRFAGAADQMRRATTTEEVYQVMVRVIQDLPGAKLYWEFPAEYGFVRAWKAKPIGGKFYVTFVLNRSDAAKSLRVGDELMTLNDSPPTQDMIGVPNSSSATPAPLETERLVVASPGEKAREVVVRSEKRLIYPDIPGFLDLPWGNWSWTAHLDRSVMMWRLPWSSNPLLLRVLPLKDVEPNLNKLLARAQRYPNLIIDLRGNSHGSVDEMVAVAAALFDHDVTLATRVGSGSKQPLVAQTHGAKHYGGRVIVLVDKQTGGPAEVLARTIQLNQRGEIIGDRTCGCTRERQTSLLVLGGIKKPLGFLSLSIPIADFIMPDGENPEGTGLTPDQTVLPSGEDLASGRDPGLETALKLAGVQLTLKEQSKRQMIQWHLQ